MKSNCHFEIKANIDYFLIKSAVWGRGAGAAARQMMVSLQKDWIVKRKGCPLKLYLYYLHLHIYIIYIYTELRYNLIAIVQYKSGNWQCNVIVNGTALKIYKFPDNVVSCIVRLWQSGAAPLLLMFAPHIITGHMVEDCPLVSAIGNVQVWATWQLTSTNRFFGQGNGEDISKLLKKISIFILCVGVGSILLLLNASNSPFLPHFFPCPPSLQLTAQPSPLCKQ